MIHSVTVVHNEASAQTEQQQIQWLRVMPFFMLHLACLLVFVVGWSWTAITIAGLAYMARLFALTAFYHRYFSHRAFKTSRLVQFLGAFVGNAAAQRGPIWWAAHHRRHHRDSDKPGDVHSPEHHGFLWSHVFWFMTREAYQTDRRVVKDWIKFPELRFLDRFDFVAPLILAAGMFALGETIRLIWPASGTSGMQLLVWGFVISTVTLYHVTFAINSLAHTIGSRRYATRDNSRNNWWLALLAFGEGWHNNHHHFPASARQGFRWWEVDISYYLLVIMSWFGLVWDIKPVPAKVLNPDSTPAKRNAR